LKNIHVFLQSYSDFYRKNLRDSNDHKDLLIKSNLQKVFFLIEHINNSLISFDYENNHIKPQSNQKSIVKHKDFNLKYNFFHNNDTSDITKVSIYNLNYNFNRRNTKKTTEKQEENKENKEKIQKRLVSLTDKSLFPSKKYLNYVNYDKYQRSNKISQLNFEVFQNLYRKVYK
jgi:hypothetical protein